MSYRRFTDRAGHRWEIRDRHSGSWEFRPVHGNPAAPRQGAAPGYQTDPFELSEQELQAVLEDATPGDGGGPGSSRPAGSGRPGGLFEDYEPPAPPKSPFLDDQ